MSLTITNNVVHGNIQVTPDEEDKYNLVFSNNLIDGNLVIDANKVHEDVSITHCSFKNIRAGMPIELWFVYANFVKPDPLHHSIQRMCSKNEVTNLILNLDGKEVIEVIERCLALLKHNVTNSLSNI